MGEVPSSEWREEAAYHAAVHLLGWIGYGDTYHRRLKPRLAGDLPEGLAVAQRGVDWDLAEGIPGRHRALRQSPSPEEELEDPVLAGIEPGEEAGP